MLERELCRGLFGSVAAFFNKHPLLLLLLCALPGKIRIPLCYIVKDIPWPHELPIETDKGRIIIPPGQMGKLRHRRMT